jgi:hypothetical protein
MTILLAIVGAAWAGAVYLNGVRADVLPEATITNATVRVDAEGNLWIEAPGYRVTVQEAGDAGPSRSAAVSAAATRPAPAPMTAAAAVSTPATRPSPAPMTAPYAASGPSAGGAAAPAVVPAGGWWLLTVDEGSMGHAVDVAVNGVTVLRAQSGQAQSLLDLGPYLRRGANTLVVTPRAGVSGAGALRVLVAAGAAVPGTGTVPGVRLQEPVVRYARVPTEPAAPRTFTFDVR